MSTIEQFLKNIITYLNNPTVLVIALFLLIPKSVRNKLLEKYVTKKFELDDKPKPMNPEMKEAIGRFTDSIISTKDSIDNMMVQFVNANVVINENINRQRVLFMDALAEIKKNSGKYLFSKEDTIQMFDIIMQNHIQQKIEVIQEKLDKNHFDERRKEILQDIKIKFKTITQEECQVMSKWHTPYGDIGLIVENYIDWDRFIKDIDNILSKKVTDELKIRDIRSLMDSMVTDIKEKFLHV